MELCLGRGIYGPYNEQGHRLNSAVSTPCQQLACRQTLFHLKIVLNRKCTPVSILNNPSCALKKLELGKQT